MASVQRRARAHEEPDEESNEDLGEERASCA
jgi:hypothetical protein